MRAGAFDREDDAGKGLAGLERGVEDVADFGTLFIVFVEEACSCTCRIENC